MWRFALLALTGCSLLSVTKSGRAMSGTTESAPTASSGSSDDGYTDGATAPKRQPVYLTAVDTPADPWMGVAGDAPAILDYDESNQYLAVDETPSGPCTAARDHCLPGIAWLRIHEGSLHFPVTSARFMVFTAEGPDSPVGRSSPSDGFVAYRTVPATRGNLIPGAVVATFDGGPIPKSSADALETWTTGTLERVDWDMGLLFYVDGKEPQLLTSARVAVLSYERGGKVKILGGKPRDQLAVKISDVILPDP